MQIQITPLNDNSRPSISEYGETTEGYEAQIIAESQANGGQNVILGESLDNPDQTQRTIVAVASNGQLLQSTLPPHA